MLLDATGRITDVWTDVSDGPIPWHGPVIVPLDRLTEALGSRTATGVRIPNDADPDALKEHLPRLGLIAIPFPSFADGRGFSLAVRLRALGYTGQLRAEGHVIADQFAYLLQCGFDQVAVRPDIAARQPLDQWIAQLSRITIGYQRGRRDGKSIPDARTAGPV